MIIVDSHISEGSFLVSAPGSRIEINNSFVGRNCVIAAKESIVIKTKCLIAEMVVIRDHDHEFSLSDDSIWDMGYQSGPILIEGNSWIAAKATILKHVIVGANSVIGANSLVNANVEPNSLYAGNPAKRIK